MDRKKVFITVVFFLNLLLISCYAQMDLDGPLVIPLPRQMSIGHGQLLIDDNTVVLISNNANENDLVNAKFISEEYVLRYGAAVGVERSKGDEIRKNVIVIGNMEEELVKRYLSHYKVKPECIIKKEGYLLYVNSEVVIITGKDPLGIFWGIQSLRQLTKKEKSKLYVQAVEIVDWPNHGFRNIRLYAPSKENIPFFKRFLRDFAVYFKYNSVQIEFGGSMVLEKHPEINTGWLEFTKDLNYSRMDRPRGPKGEAQDSSHPDTAGGGLLSKDEVRAIVSYARSLNLEVIPEIPSLTHSYYLLTKHKEFAEIKEAEWPDTYCSKEEGVYELLFDVLDEYIEVIKPKMVHIGHDELRMPVGVCKKCDPNDLPKLFAADVNKIYAFLKQRNIKTAMWGDHLLENVRGRGFRERKVKKPKHNYKIPGGLDEKLVVESIAKDILIFNWFWNEKKEGSGPENEQKLAQMGFSQVFGNLEPGFSNWQNRSANNNVLGGSTSAWVETSEFIFGKDLIYSFVGCSNMLWSKEQLNEKELLKVVQKKMATIRENLRGYNNPSRDGDTIVSVDISSKFNIKRSSNILGNNLVNFKEGDINSSGFIFNLSDNDLCGIGVGSVGKGAVDLPDQVSGIKIGKDVSSLIFLHGIPKPGKSVPGWRYIYNFDDSTDLLGFYEVVYEDGFIETIPIRYKVNILEWDGSSGNYCYGADVINCSSDPNNQTVDFYAFEWTNPRFGKVIKNVNLKGSKNFKGLWNRPVKSNAVVFVALNVVEKREVK